MSVAAQLHRVAWCTPGRPSTEVGGSSMLGLYIPHRADSPYDNSSDRKTLQHAWRHVRRIGGLRRVARQRQSPAGCAPQLGESTAHGSARNATSECASRSMELRNEGFLLGGGNGR